MNTWSVDAITRYREHGERSRSGQADLPFWQDLRKKKPRKSWRVRKERELEHTSVTTHQAQILAMQDRSC